MNQLFSNKAIKSLSKKAAIVNGMIRRNSGRPLINLFIKAGHSVVGSSKSWVRVYKHYAYFVYRLYKRGGFQYVVIYLKACSVLLQQAVGGEVIPSTQSLGAAVARTKHGIPRIIPALMRKRILAREVAVIKVFLTLFGLYRVIEYPGKLKLSTITTPPKEDIPIQEWYDFLRTVLMPMILKIWGKTSMLAASLTSEAYRARFIKDQLRAVPLLLFKASPALPERGPGQIPKISTSFDGIVGSAFSLFGHGTVWPAFQAFGRATGNTHLLNWIEEYALWAKKHSESVPQPPSVLKVKWQRRAWETFEFLRRAWWSDFTRPLYESRPIGGLGFKEEPAGKVRVFAMVDCWTQWILYPLHKVIFQLLAQIPQDGTFDQSKPVHFLLRELEKRGLKHTYCYDLSAATDRLPIALQVTLLSFCMGEKLANAWACILVGRGYTYKHHKTGVSHTLYYACGQPMGALSSWAMLALTHHCIVQWAWYRVCLKKGNPYTWFELYAVLGDDIVIGDGAVAREYLKVMEGIGVGISLAKSLVSNSRTVEFAKKFFTPDEATPIPFRELLVAERNSSVMLEFARKHKLNIPAILQLMGFGYRVRGDLHKPLIKLGRRVAVTLLALTAPGSLFGKDLREWLTLESLVRSVDHNDWARILQSFWDTEIVALADRVKALQPLVSKANAMIIVFRDREYYGTVDPGRFDMRRKSAHLFTNDKLLLHILEKDFRIADSIVERIYRPAFLWTGDEFSSLKAKLSELEELGMKFSSDPFEEIQKLWEFVDHVESALELLPLPRTMEHSEKSKTPRNVLIARGKKWFRYAPSIWFGPKR